MRHALVIGKKFSGLTNFLLENGIEYTTLTDIKTTKYPDKKFKRRVLCDYSSREKVLETVRDLLEKPDLLMTAYENYILPMSWIGEDLGTYTIPVSAAEKCTDKYLMRKAFALAPEKISPDFYEIKTEDDVINFAKTHDFPLIIKPANLSKSLLVTKSENLDELLENYQKTLKVVDKIYQKYAPDREPKLLIEEFLKGSVHSVDAFVDKNGVPHVMKEIVDYQTGYEVGYDDNFHYSRILPSRLSSEDQEKFLNCAKLGCEALGMKNSPAHIEIIMTKSGPRIVEIGARNGGYRSRMYMLANGIDINMNALKIATGEMPEISAKKNEPVAVLELFPHNPGNFVELSSEAELNELPSLEYLSIKVKPGEYSGKSSDGYKATAIIILHNSDVEQFNKDLEFVKNNVKVITR
ncbi:ATP-grasp domain-containing protein [Candidatus Saccharibacteria bacterium]|nr:ATP-grasp domain-containing protein [Candidatus Saccharibacteria bacterium]